MIPVVPHIPWVLLAPHMEMWVRLLGVLQVGHMTQAVRLLVGFQPQRRETGQHGDFQSVLVTGVSWVCS